MVQSLSVLGSTGSIGRQTLAVAKHLGIRVTALTANRQVALLEQQARFFHPEFVAVHEEYAAKQLKIALADTDIRVGSGLEAVTEAASLPAADCVVTAVSGAIGLKPTLAAIREKKRIALANKETLVCAGELVMKRAEEEGAEIVPVDSEHSAIFQCLTGRKARELKKILLTCSGGPFLGKTLAEMADIKPEEALKHPRWNMGAKISIDSATLMNKGLEFIEAMRLFSVGPEDINVVIHPQSVIHSMISLLDGTVIAQMAVPDMGLPIQYALTWPERSESEFPSLDFYQMVDFHFEAPDLVNFPSLALAMRCAREGGTAPCIMNAANEEAVHLFLRGAVRFTDIYEITQKTTDRLPHSAASDLAAILEADSAARKYALELADREYKK